MTQNLMEKKLKCFLLFGSTYIVQILKTNKDWQNKLTRNLLIRRLQGFWLVTPHEEVANVSSAFEVSSALKKIWMISYVLGRVSDPHWFNAATDTDPGSSNLSNLLALDPGWRKIRIVILDKHPESSSVILSKFHCILYPVFICIRFRFKALNPSRIY